MVGNGAPVCAHCGKQHQPEYSCGRTGEKMAYLISRSDDERLTPDTNTYYSETEICLMQSLHAALEVLDDKRQLTRELDVAMHGEEEAAKQASLCDLIEPARRLCARFIHAAARAETAESSATLFRERYELEQIRYEGISSANEELRKEAKRLREELRTGLAMTTCPACGSETAKTNEPRLNLENKRLREAVGTLCREALGAIIDATTIVRVEKLSGNIVKEAHAKGELFSLRLLESWLDRHVPEVMTELRRRADAGREET